MSRKRSLAFLIVGIVAFCLVSCQTILENLSGAASGDFSDMRALGQLGKAAVAVGKAAEPINPEEEYYLGRAVAASVFARYRPWTGPGAVDYLNTLGNALALHSQKPETFRGYHFMVLDTDDINAFGAPSGFVTVSRGLLYCATSEDEVAAILAHEIAHVSLQHGLKAISTARWTAAAVEIAKYAAMNADDYRIREINAVFGDMIGDIVKTMVNAGYSQDLEKEADLEAIRILHDVGYDPEGLVRVLQRMKPRLRAGGNDFVKTHPSPDTRIGYLRSGIAKLGPYRMPTTLQLANRQSRFAAAMAGF
jgi:predicted Zn-dependent protease